MSTIGGWIDAILAEVVAAIPTMTTLNGQIALDRIGKDDFPFTMIFDASEAPIQEIQWRVVKEGTTMTIAMVDRGKTPDEMRDYVQAFKFGLRTNHTLDLTVNWVRLVGPFTATEALSENGQDRYGIITGPLLVEFWD